MYEALGSADGEIVMWMYISSSSILSLLGSGVKGYAHVRFGKSHDLATFVTRAVLLRHSALCTKLYAMSSLAFLVTELQAGVILIVYMLQP